MKIIYLVNARIPTEKAHGFQIAKMCESFARCGAVVELVVPRRLNTIDQNAYQYYGVEHNFEITELKIPDFVGRWGRIGTYIHTTLFALRGAWYVLHVPRTIVYSRDVAPLFIIRFFRRTVLEVHNVPDRFVWLYSLSLKKIDRIISTNNWKKTFLENKCGVSLDRIVVFPNAIDIEEYNMIETRDEVCRKLGLSPSFEYILYSGHLYDWKGAHILAEAANQLPDQFRVLFVGGTLQENNLFKEKYKSEKIIYIEHRPHCEVPLYLSIASVLVVPNVAITRESEHATSPMKLFEYMAARRPIIASDLPSIREIVANDSVELVRAGDVQSLADAIKRVVASPEIADEKIRRAYSIVKNNTWAHRANFILQWIQG